MNWKVKAAIQKTISLLPQAAQLNYFFQRYITKGYPAPELIFNKKILNADKHFHAYRTFSTKTAPDDTFYEFGAGWDILIPLIYSSKGVQNQILVDINDLLKIDLVRSNISRLISKGFPLQNISGSDKAELLKQLRINFLAPHDARKTGFPADSIQFISNTDTLEHIPKDDIGRIMNECYRILAPGGIASCVVDLRDHYAYFDNSISVYNFLSFSEREWWTYNNDLHYQNRLRYADYKKIFEECGFEVVFEQSESPTPSEFETLKSLQISDGFAKKDLNELGIKEIWMILRK
jgi:SAM-dependent methyltransferase